MRTAPAFWFLPALTLLLLRPGAASANTYVMVEDHAKTWAQAKTAAQIAGGYLATITSPAEQAAVEAAIAAANPSGEGGVWINLRETTERCYVWDTGETPAYGHFLPPGEPNNLNGVETRGHILWSNDLGRRGYWNDIHQDGVNFGVNDIGRLGYVIEFGPVGQTGSGCVPVPPIPFPALSGWSLAAIVASLLLAGSAALKLAGRGRRTANVG